MSYIDRHSLRPRSDHARALFQSARHTMSLALIAWLNCHPDADDVDLETDAACSIIRQLVALVRSA